MGKRSSYQDEGALLFLGRSTSRPMSYTRTVAGVMLSLSFSSQSIWILADGSRSSPSTRITEGGYQVRPILSVATGHVHAFLRTGVPLGVGTTGRCLTLESVTAPNQAVIATSTAMDRRA